MSHTNLPPRGKRLLPRPDHPSKPKYPEAEIVAAAIDRHGLSVSIGLNEVACALRKLTPAPGDGVGHFALHVTEVTFQPEQEPDMPPTTPIDTTPPLDLASSSVRAKISVVNPRMPDGSRTPPASIVWSTDDETELPLEACPDDTVKDEGGVEVLDPADSLPLNIHSTFANTPLTPEPGAKADGTVTCSATGMASITKLVRYGDAAVGHFTMVATEAPEA